MPEVAIVVDESRKVRGAKRPVTITAAVEKITPDKAVRWLEDTETVSEIRNRGVSDGNVALFAESMVRGAWEITHQGIALYKVGDKWVVLDGQHRLWAVVKSQVPVMMMVSRFEGGKIADAIEMMKAFDRGQKRNLGQVLKISKGIERGSARAAACRYLLAFLRGGGSGDSRHTRIIDSDILDAVERYATDLDWFVTLRRGAGNVFLSAPVAACLVYAHSVDQYRDGVEKFGRQLSGGEGIFAGDPALMFREWVLNRGSDNLLRRPEGRMHLMRICFRAIQAAVQSKKITRFNDTMEGFEFFRSAKEPRRARRE